MYVENTKAVEGNRKMDGWLDHLSKVFLSSNRIGIRYTEFAKKLPVSTKELAEIHVACIKIH